MPNWVKNIVSFSDPKALKHMLVKDKNGNDYFDFNQAIPMPKELEDSKLEYPDKRTDEEIKALVDKYGASDWYHWSIENWGTKWNASEVYVIDDCTVEFDTAWSTPAPVLQALSMMFPNTRVHVEYADEDLGNNCGGYTYINADLCESTQPDADDALKFACDVWGLDYEEELREREEWDNE